MSAAMFVLIAALVVAAGFFAAGETAVLASNRMRMRRRAAANDKRAAAVLRFLERPDRFLTAVLLSNNIAIVAATSLLTLAAQRSAGELGGVVAGSLVMTAALTLFAEIIPKVVTLEDPDGYATAFAPVLRVVQKAFVPAVWAANILTLGLPRRLGKYAESVPFVTREELRALLTERPVKTRADLLQRRMVRRIFYFTETTARHIMVPLSDVRALPADAIKADVIKAVTDTGLSKYPVYRGRREQVEGIVVARDVLAASAATPITAYLHAPLFVSPDESIATLLPKLRAHAVDMAVVRDAGGNTLGILTGEDIAEEVVGEIEDEYDWGPVALVRGGSYTADARLPLSHFNRRMPVGLPAGDYVTLGGFLAARLGRVPVAGDTYVWPPYRFRVLRATAQAARLIGIEMLNPPGKAA